MQTFPQLIELARELRKHQTDAEEFLWQLLRNRQLNDAKFRRQHPIENYIADFYCHEHNLVIELDGSQHLTVEGLAKDKVRTERFNQSGIKVLRFDNRVIFLRTKDVLEEIYFALSLNPSPNPLPEGEGF